MLIPLLIEIFTLITKMDPFTYVEFRYESSLCSLIDTCEKCIAQDICDWCMVGSKIRCTHRPHMFCAVGTRTKMSPKRKICAVNDPSNCSYVSCPATASFECTLNQFNNTRAVTKPTTPKPAQARCPELAADCGTCMALDHKYKCGWCKSTNSCAVESQCRGHNDGGWLSGDQKCPAEILSVREAIIRGRVHKIMLNVSNLPSSKHGFLSVFTIQETLLDGISVGKKYITNATMRKNNISLFCDLPHWAIIPKIPEIRADSDKLGIFERYVFIKLSIKTRDGPEFVSTEIILEDPCERHKTCDACFSSQHSCSWCMTGEYRRCAHEAVTSCRRESLLKKSSPNRVCPMLYPTDLYPTDLYPVDFVKVTAYQKPYPFALVAMRVRVPRGFVNESESWPFYCRRDGEIQPTIYKNNDVWCLSENAEEDIEIYEPGEIFTVAWGEIPLENPFGFDAHAVRGMDYTCDYLVPEQVRKRESSEQVRERESSEQHFMDLSESLSDKSESRLWHGCLRCRRKTNTTRLTEPAIKARSELESRNITVR